MTQPISGQKVPERQHRAYDATKLVFGTSVVVATCTFLITLLLLQKPSRHEAPLAITLAGMALVLGIAILGCLVKEARTINGQLNALTAENARLAAALRNATNSK